jgi:hypothetical protein
MMPDLGKYAVEVLRGVDRASAAHVAYVSVAQGAAGARELDDRGRRGRTAWLRSHR